MEDPSDERDLKARLDAQLHRHAAAADAGEGALLAVDAPMINLRHGSGAADRPFRIASLTKVFVAAAMHVLAEQGRVDLLRPIGDLISGDTQRLLLSGGYDPGRITSLQLLSHTSGLVDHTAAPTYGAAILANPERRWTRSEQIALAMQAGTPCGRPGELYSYSDTGFVVLGEIIERVSGRSLAAAVRTLLRFDGLGLTCTWWEELEPAPAAGAAVLSAMIDGIDTTAFNPSFDLWGGGGLVSTAGDINRFIRALLGGEVFRSTTLVGALAVPVASQATTADDPWRVHSFLLAAMRVGDRWAWGHTGFWGSGTVYFAELDAAVTVSMNVAGPRAFAAMRALLDETVRLLDAQWRARCGPVRL